MTAGTVDAPPATNARALEVKQKLIEINSQHNDLVLTNGLLLKEYKEGAYFKEDGFTSFDEAIDTLHERGVLDYGARNARHFIAVVDMVHNLGIPAAEVRQLGISKLREAASLKDEKDQRQLLADAKTKTVGEVQKEAKRLRDKAAGRETDPLDAYTFMLTATQKSFVKDCLAAARKAYSIEDNVPEAAVLTDYILAEWHSGLGG